MSEKVEQLASIWEDVQQCHKCDIRGGVKNQVFGDGRASARICVVGEGPGEDEDANGHPFQGEAGKLLNRILKESGGLNPAYFAAVRELSIRYWLFLDRDELFEEVIE